MVIAFDVTTLTDASRTRAVEVMRRMVEDVMPVDTQASVVTLRPEVGVLSDFTADRERLRGALTTVGSQASRGAGVQRAADLAGFVHATCDRLRPLPQQKLLVVATGAIPGDRSEDERTANLRAADRACQDAHATVQFLTSFDSGELLAMGLGATTGGPAQARTFSQFVPAAPPSNARFAQADVVLVDVNVTDAAGQPVASLRPEDFQVLENGMAQKVIYFQVTSPGRIFATGQTIGPPLFYTLAYEPPKQAATERNIRVVVSRPGTFVTARTRYSMTQDAFLEGTYPEDTPGLISPVVRDRREPRYPGDAFRAKLQGDVEIEAVIGVDGHVTRARVARSLDSTAYGLDDAALDAARQWTFTPGELKGEKVSVLVRLIVAFRIH